MEEKIKRERWLTVRLSAWEEKALLQLYSRTTSRSLSEYARAVLLKDPVTVLYRDASADDFLTQMLQLKSELTAIGNNFNQAVHKLHTLDRLPQAKAWSSFNESHKQLLFQKIDEIMDKANEIYSLWLLK